MRYKNIFHQAYTLTIHNPLMWLFGLVLLGGFNLSLVNFFALMPSDKWKSWPVPMSAMYGQQSSNVLLALVAAAILFVVLNFVKIIFIAVAHGLIHEKNSRVCRLCVHVENKTSPYYVWWVRVMLSSVITIAMTLGVSIAANVLVGPARVSPTAIVINLIFVAIVTCAIGTWNAFTSYFIVFHDMNFTAASTAALDLIVMHFRRILELVVVLSAIYTVAVVVGNAFINVWHHGFVGADESGLRILALFLFAAWFAVNNTFFNLAFLLFFDRAVRSTPASEEIEPLAQMH